MNEIKELTGLEFPKYEVHVGSAEIDDLSAYVASLEAYAFGLENYIMVEEQKKEGGKMDAKEKKRIGDLNIIYNNLKDIANLNSRAIDLNNNMYIMLADSPRVYTDEAVINVLRGQWYDVLHRQEQIIMNLQSYVNGRIRDKEQRNG